MKETTKVTIKKYIIPRRETHLKIQQLMCAIEQDKFQDIETYSSEINTIQECRFIIICGVIF